MWGPCFSQLPIGIRTTSVDSSQRLTSTQGSSSKLWRRFAGTSQSPFKVQARVACIERAILPTVPSGSHRVCPDDLTACKACDNPASPMRRRLLQMAFLLGVAVAFALEAQDSDVFIQEEHTP